MNKFLKKNLNQNKHICRTLCCLATCRLIVLIIKFSFSFSFHFLATPIYLWTFAPIVHFRLTVFRQNLNIYFVLKSLDFRTIEGPTLLVNFFYIRNKYVCCEMPKLCVAKGCTSDTRKKGKYRFMANVEFFLFRTFK